jgi:hypothetical protein
MPVQAHYSRLEPLDNAEPRASTSDFRALLTRMPAVNHVVWCDGMCMGDGYQRITGEECIGAIAFTPVAEPDVMACKPHLSCDVITSLEDYENVLKSDGGLEAFAAWSASVECVSVLAWSRYEPGLLEQEHVLHNMFQLYQVNACQLMFQVFPRQGISFISRLLKCHCVLMQCLQV